MNHEQINFVNREYQILNQAIANLPEKWTPTFEPCNKVECGNGKDGKLNLFEGRYEFAVEIKRIHRKAGLQSLSHDFPSNNVLICNTLTPFLADYCEQLKINFIDASGNAQIHYRDLHLHIQGKKSQAPGEDKTTTGKALTEGTMKLAFTLLNDHALLTLPYRKLATYAGISLGMVSKGMRFLEEQKYIRPTQSGKRLLEDGKPLQEKWINDYPTVLRPKFNGVTLNYTHDWQHLERFPECTLGGEAAAAKLTRHIDPEQLLAFTSKPLQSAIKELAAFPAENGNLWLVEAFWNNTLKISEYGMALLSTAELSCSPDSRNQDMAKTLHEQYLATN